jgi:hypothetical protein
MPPPWSPAAWVMASRSAVMASGSSRSSTAACFMSASGLRRAGRSRQRAMPMIFSAGPHGSCRCPHCASPISWRGRCCVSASAAEVAIRASSGASRGRSAVFCSVASPLISVAGPRFGAQTFYTLCIEFIDKIQGNHILVIVRLRRGPVNNIQNKLDSETGSETLLSGFSQPCESPHERPQYQIHPLRGRLLQAAPAYAIPQGPVRQSARTAATRSGETPGRADAP